MRTAARPLGVFGLVVGIVLAALLATYWLGGGTVGTAPGDPDSADPTGARAVSTILTERGHLDVRTARSLAEVGDVGGGTLVVATSRKLSDPTLTRLREAAHTADGLVLVRPHADTLAVLAPGVSEQGHTAGVLSGDCAPLGLDPGLEISGDAQLYRVRPLAGTSGGACFMQVGGGTGLPGAVAWTMGTRRTVVLGNLDMLTNGRLLEVDNAAVALRVLGATDRLVWYLGGSEDATAAPPKDESLWPPAWLGPITLALAGIVLALMLWRGRRLGRLATEPLPVVVQATETTLARGRLYRRGKDPGHAARVLQDAVRRRIGAALAVPRTADPAVFAAAAARASGRDVAQIHDLLTRPATSDADLGALATELARLDREVRRA